MLSRLIFGLALGLLMYMPRPRGDSPPPTLPPGVDGPPDDAPFPPDDGVPDVPATPDMPDLSDLPHPPDRRPAPMMPSVPPTPPPGYEGEWPPASERPDVPPTPPPGYDGIWPDSRPSLRDRILDLLRDLNIFDSPYRKRIMYMDAHDGAKAIGGALKADAVEAQDA